MLNRSLEVARRVDKQFTRWSRGGSRSVLVDARTPNGYDIIAPIYRSIRDPRVKFYFTSSQARGSLAEIFRTINAGTNIISPSRASLMRFDAYIVADLLWAKLPRGTNRILMFHGVAGKFSNQYDSPDCSMRHWDRIFFINQRRLRNFVNSGAIDDSSPSARLVGYPKLDRLVDGSLTRDDILRSLRLKAEKRTVLYAPTWTVYSSLNKMGEQVVRKLCLAGYQVMVKLHDRSRDVAHIHSGGVDWPLRLGAILQDAGGHLATGSDVTPYLAAADVLITDHSSAGFEYLLLDRPLLRIDMPDLITATNIHTDYVSLIAECSSTVRGACDVVDAVEYSFANYSALSTARRKVAQDLFYRPGTATQRAVKELYEVLELDPY